MARRRYISGSESGRGRFLLLAFSILALAAVLASGGVSSSASRHSREHGIRVGVGIAGVRIGMTRAQVRGALGAPRRVKVFKNSAFGPGHPVFFSYGGLKVEFWKGAPRNPSGSRAPDRKLRVASIGTSRRELRTRRDIGVGSRERQVRRKVAGVRCETLSFNGRRYRNCHSGRYDCKPPSWVLGDLPCHVSAFVLNHRHGRVVRVQIGWLGSPSGKVK